MKFKPWMCALAMATSAVGAQATDYQLVLSNAVGAPSATESYFATGTIADTINLVADGVGTAGLTLTGLYVDYPGLSSHTTNLSATLQTATSSGSSATWTDVATGTSFKNLTLAAGTFYRLLVSGNAGTGGLYTISYVASVPEPASIALFLAGIGALGLVARRRKIAEKEPVDAALA